jgi:hypothetical protein
VGPMDQWADSLIFCRAIACKTIKNIIVLNMNGRQSRPLLLPRRRFPCLSRLQRSPGHGCYIGLALKAALLQICLRRPNECILSMHCKLTGPLKIIQQQHSRNRLEITA